VGNKKKIAKFLREEGKKLPDEEYTAFHRYSTIQYHQDGDQAYPVYGEMEKHKVNHGRRLKRLFKKHGKPAVDSYFEKRGFKLVNKEEFNNLKNGENEDDVHEDKTQEHL